MKPFPHPDIAPSPDPTPAALARGWLSACADDPVQARAAIGAIWRVSDDRHRAVLAGVLEAIERLTRGRVR